jgi:autotransporter strand-loop-strand O-heptosyltransferase
MMKWHGLYIDFNRGPQVFIPPNSGLIRYRFIDRSGKIPEYSGVTENDPENITCEHSNYQYYIPWRVELEHEDGSKFEHDLDLTGQRVLINMTCALGDSVAWMPAVKAFQEKWHCETIVCMNNPSWICLYKDVYPELRFVTIAEANTIKAWDTYARYQLAVFGYEGSELFELMDYRENNLIRHAEMILGMDPVGKPPLIHKSELPNPSGKYVCIATRASRPCKEWKHPYGWELLCSWCIENGYKVYCIDADDRNIPRGAINCTGHLPLDMRAKMIAGAEFFVGLPSGLSWLAWAVGTPVVLISGFTDAYVEFETPYRVSPPVGKCHGCWKDSDQRQGSRFDHCYRYFKGYDPETKQPIPYWNGETAPVEQFECTKSITADMVIVRCREAVEDRELTRTKHGQNTD